MKLRKFLLGLMVLSAAVLTDAAAQSARSVLDKTSNLLKSSGGIQATFEATSFKGTQEAGTTSGTIYVQGEKFKIVSPQLTTWFDGKTQWSYMTNSGEAYVSNPTDAELQSINPYTFINLYKSGYAYTMSDTNYNGKACHEVRLTATKRGSNISEMLIVIDKSGFLPYSVRLKQSNGTWLRLRVRNVQTRKSWNEKFFQFDKTAYPDVEIIDLR